MNVSVDKKTILSFLVAFAILYILVTKADIHNTWEIIKATDVGIYLIACSLMFFSIILRSLRWKKLLENIGIRGRFKDITEILTISFFVNTLVPAKLGDVYRGYLMKKNYKEEMSRVMSTVFVERSFDIIAMVVISCAIILLSFKKIPQNIALSLKVGIVLSVLLAGFLIIMKYHDEWIFRFIPKRAEKKFDNFRNDLSDTLASSSMLSVGSYTGFIWLIDGGRMFLVMKATGLDVPFSLAVFVVLAGALATAFPFTPAGLGAVELTMIGLMVLLGIEKELAVSITILERLISYWALLIFGGIMYVVSNKK